MTERPEPGEVITRGPVTLRRWRVAGRRPLDEPPPAGNGVGVVWRLVR